ncbi:MAG: DUF423 domain-containing protein [Gammaproteobacteria bacterium]|nr:DUF423 domain-containing protein [Gammaproteobacteria bacterium]
MTKWMLLAGSLCCASAILIGAFGAHALKPILTEQGKGWLDTGVFYQMSHGLALLACGLLPTKTQSIAASFFIAGILLFSGSLYCMAITGNTQLGIITPIGGVCFLVGWGLFCLSVWRMPASRYLP